MLMRAGAVRKQLHVRLALEPETPNLRVLWQQGNLGFVEGQAGGAAVALGFVSYSCSSCSVPPLQLQSVKVEFFGCLHPQVAAQPTASVVRFHALQQLRATVMC
jgi:hypothetical protein